MKCLSLKSIKLTDELSDVCGLDVLENSVLETVVDSSQMQGSDENEESP